MNPSSTNQNVSVIVAYRISRGHLLDVFADLRLWFNDITIVGPACYEISEQIKSLGGKWLEDESNSIQDLWDRGIQSVDSEWYLLLEGSEYIFHNTRYILKPLLPYLVQKKLALQILLVFL